MKFEARTTPFFVCGRSQSQEFINPLMNSSASATGAPFLSSEIASMQDFFMIKPIS